MNELYEVLVNDVLRDGRKPDEETIHNLIDHGPTDQRTQQRKALDAVIDTIREERPLGARGEARDMTRKALARFTKWNESASENPVETINDRTDWGPDGADYDHEATRPLRDLFEAARHGREIPDADIDSLRIRDNLTAAQRDKWRAELRSSLDEVRLTADNGHGVHRNGEAQRTAEQEAHRLGQAMSGTTEPERILGDDHLTPAELAAMVGPRRAGR